MLDLSGVSRVCLGLQNQTLDSYSPRVRAAGVQVSRVARVFTRARACIYRNRLWCFLFMREQKTLSTLDTLDSYKKVFVFKRVLLSGVVSRVGGFVSRVGKQGVLR